MKVQDFKIGCGFIVEGFSFASLCSCLVEYPGVSFTDRRRFFWGAGDIRGEFMFHGHTFKIEIDAWDGENSIFVYPKDKGMSCPEGIESSPELVELRDYVLQYCSRNP